MNIMKMTVNEKCIGCGLCTEICPEIFSLTDNGLAEAGDEIIPENVAPSAEEALENCPVSAIEYVED